MRKYKKYFNNKTCDFCKAPAVLFRQTARKNFMLCDSKECDLKSRIQAGLIDNPFKNK